MSEKPIEIMKEELRNRDPGLYRALKERDELDDYLQFKLSRWEREFGVMITRDRISPLKAFGKSLHREVARIPIVEDERVSSKSTAAHGRTVQFAVEGYSLRWNGNGLRINSTDYHAGELSLDWGYLFDLAEAADHRIPPKR